MIKFKKTLAVILLVTATVFVSGCKPEDEPNNGGEMNDEVVNPNYVPIDWNEAVLVASDDNTGDYQIQFNGEMPELQPGSIVAIDRETEVLYRFVESVNVEGNSVRITSSEAYLTDIFANTDFTLSTAMSGKSKGGGRVYYPEAVYLHNDDGTYTLLHGNASRDDGDGFTHDLWHYGDTLDDLELASGDHYSVKMEKLNMTADLDLVMWMNFSGRDSAAYWGNGIQRFMSRALEVKAYLEGSFAAEQMIRCDIDGSCEYAPGSDLWKRDVFPPLSFRVLVGNVPILVTLTADLYREVKLAADGEMTAYTGMAETANGKYGLDWKQKQGAPGLIKELSYGFDFTPPTVEGKGEIEAKLWVFPRINVSLYHFVGPSFDIKPFLSTTLSGGFKEQMLGQSDDFCAWGLDCNTGLDACCGLSLRFVGLSKYWPTPNMNLIDKPLYHSPLKLDHSPQTVELEQTTTVSFNVYDMNYLANTDVLTPLPQIVKFEANGELSSEYGIAHNGRVTVDWTPVLNDILYAKLYDIDGNVMAWDTVMAPQEDLFVDLGLPSGTLWATRNVGANAPEEYGDYFAWGETEPKSDYSWETYKYGNSSNDLTKYCSDPKYGHDGFVDNLTVLQSEDDAASAKWGENARIPTKEEWEEMIANTTSIWTTINGVNGRCYTGMNGNSIFLPAASSYFGNEISEIGYSGRVLTSTLVALYPSNAYYYDFSSGECVIDFGDYSRTQGMSVRAVRSARQN